MWLSLKPHTLVSPDFVFPTHYVVNHSITNINISIPFCTLLLCTASQISFPVYFPSFFPNNFLAKNVKKHRFLGWKQMTWAIFKAEIEVSKACYSSLSSKVYGLGISKFLVRRARFFSVATVSRSHPGVTFSGLSAWYLIRIFWIWFVMTWNLLLETLSKLKVVLLKFKIFPLNSRISLLNLNFWKLCCAWSHKIGENRLLW